MDAPAPVRHASRHPLPEHHEATAPMIRWTGFVIAHRKRIVACWLVLFALGGGGAPSPGGLLSEPLSVPGAEAEPGPDLIKDPPGDRSAGAVPPVPPGGGS